MKLIKNQLVVNGKRRSASELTSMEDHVADNIILYGFSDVESLLNILESNTYDSEAFKLRVLNRLLDIFVDSIHRQSKLKEQNLINNVDTDQFDTNIEGSAEKIKIICDVISQVQHLQYNEDNESFDDEEYDTEDNIEEDVIPIINFN